VTDQNRSRLTWASGGVVAVMVRHQRPQQNLTPHSTAPWRSPRRGGHGVIMAPYSLNLKLKIARHNPSARCMC
jgi:hypothetical protein